MIVLVYGMLFVVFETQSALFEGEPGVRLWLPAAGLHLGLLVVFGARYLPVVLAAILTGELVLSGTPVTVLHLIVPGLLALLGYGAASVWLRRGLREGPWYAMGFVKRVVGLALVVPVVVGVLSVLSYTLTGRPGFTSATFSMTATRVWIGQVSGILTMLPLLLLAVGTQVHPWMRDVIAGEALVPPRGRGQLTNLGLELGAIILVLYVTFGTEADPVSRLYLCLLPTLWVAVRHGLGRAVLTAFLTNLGMVVVLVGHGDGALVGQVAFFMGVLTLVALGLGALVSERVRMLDALNKASEAAAARLEGHTRALREAEQRLQTQIREHRYTEASLQASLDTLREKRDALEAAMLQQAELNEKLYASEQSLKEINARKDKFFSIVSHDVKSMLVSAIGFSKLLVGDADTLPREMVKEFASHVYSSTTNTYDLLENLLTWTRMQTGRMLYQRAWHGVDELIQNNLTMLRDNAARKGIQLQREGDRDAQVYADRNMINSVLQNLLSNAIKFTEHGGEITVRSRTFDQTVEISVTDTGIGINPEDLEKLFRIDVNHSTPGTDDENGTGLGLVLCKEMIEKHEGRIWAESKPGRGSSFHFTLPCAS